MTEVAVISNGSEVVDRRELGRDRPKAMDEDFRRFGGNGVTAEKATRRWQLLVGFPAECELKAKLAHPPKVE